MMDVHASNILLCLRYGIGDLIMELPILDRLREVVPHATITGLGAEPAIEILAEDPRLDRILTIQHWGIRHLGDPADEPARRRFAAWLDAGRFDLILDPSHAANLVKQIIYERNIPIRDSEGACLEVGLAQGRDGLWAVKHAIRQGWGLDVPASAHPRVPRHAREIDWARRFLAERDLTGNVVAVAPGASHDLKRWPMEHFVRLCRDLREDMGASILFFCGPGEAKLLRELQAWTRGLDPVRIADRLPLRRVAALLGHCVLYLGNDSGLMHLAAAVGTPVLVLFGPTEPQLYLPGWVPSRAVTSRVACPHRPRRTFGHPPCVLAGSCLIGTPCIRTIDPAQVCAAVKEQYANRPPRRATLDRQPTLGDDDHGRQPHSEPQ